MMKDNQMWLTAFYVAKSYICKMETELIEHVIEKKVSVGWKVYHV